VETEDERVKLIPALALFALVGFFLGGCGSGKKAVSGSLTVTGITTISKVRVGTLIRCTGGPAVKVPHWFGARPLSFLACQGRWF
jgi:hypothetical protein